MAGTVTRDTQTLPITAPVQQGAAHITGSSTPLDGTTIQEPFVILLDESNPSRQVSPADEVTLQGAAATLVEVAADLAPSALAGLSSMPASTTSAVLVFADDTRRGVQVVNEATSATLFLAYAGTATLTAYTVKLWPGAYWEMPPQVYTGDISGIWDVAEVDAAARITVIPGLLE